MRATAACAVPKGPLVVVVAGPTASGKTGVGVELALRLGGEVVSADSVQVSRGLDVGSGKATIEERRGVPHHMLDVAEPEEDFSAGRFHAAAVDCVAQITGRGRTPIIVGGTSFYLRWLLHGSPGTPKGDAQSRQRAVDAVARGIAERITAGDEEDTEEGRWRAATDVLRRSGDADSAESIPRNNYYQLYRALEIVQMSGRPKASYEYSLHGERAGPPTGGVEEGGKERRGLLALGYDVVGFVLSPPRQELYGRIDRRCEAIIEGGLFEEADMLLSRGLGPDSCSATRAVGYRQAMELLESIAARHAGASAAYDGSLVTEAELEQCVVAIMAATRSLGSRQLAWHRGDHFWHWHPAQSGAASIAADIISVIESPRGDPTPFDADISRVSDAEAKIMKTLHPRPIELADKQRLASLARRVSGVARAHLRRLEGGGERG